MRCGRFGLVLLLIVPPIAAQEPRLAWTQDAEGRLSVILEGVGHLDDVEWSTALTAHVGDCVTSPMAPSMFAQVAVTEVGASLGRVLLVPRFDLDPSASYCAVFEHDDLRLTAAWAGIGSASPLRVEGLVPSRVILPANTLRLYVEFSRPVFARDVHVWARLRDESRGEWVEEPFVDIPEGLWDADRRRLTLVFHPGRIKRGVGPNLALGPPLEAGHRYRLVVEPPAGVPASFEFTATDPDRQAVDPERWRLRAPEHATAPLLVEFGESLDPYLVERWLWIESTTRGLVDTVVKVRGDGGGATFKPRFPWPDGGLELVVDRRLEDLAGNRVGQLFERQPGQVDSEESERARPPLRLRIDN